MTRRLRLLLIAPFPPRHDAGHGGARATAHLAEGLAQRHDVTLLHFRAADEPPGDPTLQHRGVRLVEVPRQSNHGPLGHRLRRAARLLAAPARGVPIWAEAFHDSSFAARLREELEAVHPDVVQAEFHVMGPYLRALERPGAHPPARVLVEHEPGVPAAAERLRESPVYARPWHRLDLAAWRRFEPGVLRSADAVVAFTERDREALLALAPAVRVETIPLAVPLAPPPPPIPSEGGTLLFVGNFAHPPNREAAHRLTHTIFPAIRARCPEARLLLVGPHPDRQWAGPGVEVTGWVDDVAPYLAAADVVAAPIFSGGGMRLKVLEALAAGKAVVASPLAVAGLDVSDGAQVALASDDATFAGRIVHLLTDVPARTALAERARQWAEQHVSVDRMARAYEILYDSLLTGRSPTS